MAFDAVVSLKSIIENYLIDHHDSLVDREILEFAYKQVESSEEIAKRVFGSSDSRLVAEIKDAANKLGEALEEGIENLEREIHFFTETMNKLEEEFADQLYNSLPEGEVNDEVVSPTTGSDMVGLSNHYNHLKKRLTVQCETQLQVVSLVGMAGIGKTTLATKIFEDRDIIQHLDCCVWVRVGRKCRSKEIPRRILAAMNLDGDQMRVENDEDIARRLNESLKGKRYLIVLDDIWDKYIPTCLQTRFPDEQNGSRFLLTSRLQLVGHEIPVEKIEMRLMNKEESWHLLREKVFAQEESCPSQLEEIGKRIAEKCEGLPLTIVAVANLLSEAEKTIQYWNEVAALKTHQLFKAAYDETSRVLLPSYNHLPRLLQLCFLYIGVFPLNYGIPLSKLFNMWYVDGFLEVNADRFTYHDAIECLRELFSNSMVIMIIKNTMNATCRLHTSLWHLSNGEARKIKFSHVLNSRGDGLGDDIKSQRRLYFHNNILFGIKEVIKSVEENCASTAHSVFCYGPYLPYQVPLCYGLRLLRELDALTIRFYEFPTEVLELVELRYLALTLNGKLPASLSKLSNLKFLIVDRHLSIKHSRTSSYLPVEIWNMKDLEHVQVTGSDLPNPCSDYLESLHTLSSVSPHSCRYDVFMATPNLKKLGIQVELPPGNDGEPLICLDHISHLRKLESLKCVVVNPKAVSPFAPLSTFPLYLRKLSLSGLGYAWEEMSKIASLEHLVVLKLRSYAFRGLEWEVESEGFPSLQSLEIEDTDLVKWKIGHGSLHQLKFLFLRGCYKLKEIHGEFGEFLQQVVLVDCHPLVVDRISRLR